MLIPLITTVVNNQGNPGNNRPLIYVVDDEPMLLELAAAILEPQGYKVAGFRTGEAALEAFLSQPSKPRLVITDFAMGPAGCMNGLELIDACRKRDPQQKMVLLSGTADESVCGDAPSKPDTFIAKPYTPMHLIKVVRSLVGI